MSLAMFDKNYGANPAENYERFFVAAIGEPLARDLVARINTLSSDRVLDVACGTGIVARLIMQSDSAPRFIAGLDPNGAMLSVAKTVAGDRANVEWHQAPAEQLPFPDDSFDLVTCQMGLQFMTNPSAALKEMWRVLADHGRIFLSLPGPSTGIFASLAESLTQHVGPQAGNFVNRVFSIHDLAEIEVLLQSARFSDVSVHATKHDLKLPPAREFLWQYIHSTPIVQSISQVRPDARNEFENAVLTDWKEFESDGVLRHNLRLVVASGVKAVT